MRRRLVLLLLLVIVAALGGRAALLLAASDTGRTDDLPPVPHGEHRAALVLGAGLLRDGRPSPVLHDRVAAATRLLARGQADLLLMSGDNSREGYSEPSAMRTLAAQLGAPLGRIAVDYGGRRTWDSCRRARTVFGVRDVVVVTSDFHRARGAVLCRAAGLSVDGAVGVSSTRYGGYASWSARELLASWRGAFDAWVHHPPVAVTGQPIDPYDACDVWRSLRRADRERTPPAARTAC